jgi:RNA polymerase sigma factor for flagellar operon FliA
MASGTRDPDFSSIRTDEAAIWLACLRGDMAARQRLIEHYLPLARILAGKLFALRPDQDVEFAEYLQLATLGLIEAVDRFNPDRDTQFTTFAGYRIHGAILNGLESLTEKRAQYASQARPVHSQFSGERRDSLKPLLDVSVDAAKHDEDTDPFHSLAEMAIHFALAHLLDDPDAFLPDEARVPDNPYTGVVLKDLRRKVQGLIQQLPQRERLVIKYHYLNQVPFEGIATALDISPGRVSQLHREALSLLRQAIRAVPTRDRAW